MKYPFDMVSTAGVLSLLAIVVLGLSVHEYRSTVSAYEEARERIRPRLVRLATTDRLMGARIPDVPLIGLAGRKRHLLPRASSITVLWFVKARECPSCLEQRLARWHDLAGNSALDARIILVGTSIAEARTIVAGAGIRTEVLVDSGSVVVRRLGLPAPSVSLVVDHNGVVLLADARFIGTMSRCGWGFFQQVHAIFGGGDPERIRAVAMTPPGFTNIQREVAR